MTSSIDGAMPTTTTQLLVILSSSNNSATIQQCPSANFRFAPDDLIIVICYCILFLIAICGNGTMLLILNRNLFFHNNRDRRPNRILLLLLHMNIADLIVTFEHLPKSIIHKVTVGWYGGDLLCKLCKFFDVFGVSLSTNILICMCIDRFFSVYSPLSTLSGLRRVKTMIYVAWISAIIVSLPQLFLWVTASPECNRSFTQCVARSFIGQLNPRITLVYTMITAVQSYFLPLCVIIVCYTFIFCRLSRTVETHRYVVDVEQNNVVVGVESSLSPPTTSAGGGRRDSGAIYTNSNPPRASGVQLSNLRRAKTRTLHMTLVIVFCYLVCWSPYYAATSIRFFDMDYTTGRIKGNIPVPKLLIEVLYVFAVVNSCLNPLLYGFFSFDLKKEFAELCRFRRLATIPSAARNSTTDNNQRTMNNNYNNHHQHHYKNRENRCYTKVGDTEIDNVV